MKSKKLSWVNSLTKRIMRFWEWGGECNHLYKSIEKPEVYDEPWVISIAPAVQEILEIGPRDGEKQWTPFMFDISGFVTQKCIKNCSLAICTSCPPDIPSQLTLLFLYNDKYFVNLRILLQPPPDMEPLEIIDIAKGEVRKK